jgi:adenosine deaminase
MRSSSSDRRILLNLVSSLTLVLLCAIAATAQAPDTRSAGLKFEQSASEQKTVRYFETVRKSTAPLWAFLLKMPKGGDLHNHLSGAIYAESYIQWAAENGLCVNNQTMALSVPPTKSACDPKLNQIPADTALTNSVFFQQLIDAWSMQNWELSGETGHDQFFNTFAKFGPATWDQTGRMLAEAATRAAHGHVLYLELMLTPDGTISSDLGKQVPWDGNVQSTLKKLQDAGIANAATAGIKNIQAAETQKDQLLKCGTPQAEPGCQVTIRYISQVSRGGSLGSVFAQMVTGFTLASEPNSKVVALNLVQAEDGAASMQNFSVQMDMLHSLRALYPKAHLTLHAGELVPGLVPPAGLKFHIRESVMTAGAERIGHGVDVVHEDRPEELIAELARRRVLVEICLSSNNLILGVSGPQHPLATYIKYGVPVALNTDDEGVSRSEISREYLRGVQDQGLGYLQLKTMARTSLQYAFIPGGSLWSDAGKFTPVAQCAKDLAQMKLGSSGCRQFIAANEKAKLQWQLEADLRAFESGF